jgi:hypothetical protein
MVIDIRGIAGNRLLKAHVRKQMSGALARLRSVRVEHMGQTPRRAFDEAFTVLERQLERDVERARQSRADPRNTTSPSACSPRAARVARSGPAGRCELERSTPMAKRILVPLDQALTAEAVIRAGD